MNDSKPENKITLSSIVCIAKNYAIGKDNAMIWHIPEDLKHFKRTTLGKPIIMGRKSYEALGKPLPGRANIVISRSHEPLGQTAHTTKNFADMEAAGRPVKEGTSLHKTSSIEEAITLARSIAQNDGKDEIFITGGGQIYAETLPYTERLYITILDREYEATTFFPEINYDEWTITEEHEHDAQPDKDRPAFKILTLERI